MKRKYNVKQVKKDPPSELIKCSSCGQNFWVGSLEGMKEKKCLMCRKGLRPNPNIEPPNYDMVTEGWNPDKVKR